MALNIRQANDIAAFYRATGELPPGISASDPDIVAGLHRLGGRFTNLNPAGGLDQNIVNDFLTGFGQSTNRIDPLNDVVIPLATAVAAPIAGPAAVFGSLVGQGIGEGVGAQVGGAQGAQIGASIGGTVGGATGGSLSSGGTSATSGAEDLSKSDLGGLGGGGGSADTATAQALRGPSSAASGVVGATGAAGSTGSTSTGGGGGALSSPGDASVANVASGASSAATSPGSSALGTGAVDASQSSVAQNLFRDFSDLSTAAKFAQQLDALTSGTPRAEQTQGGLSQQTQGNPQSQEQGQAQNVVPISSAAPQPISQIASSLPTTGFSPSAFPSGEIQSITQDFINQSQNAIRAQFANQNISGSPQEQRQLQSVETLATQRANAAQQALSEAGISDPNVFAALVVSNIQPDEFGASLQRLRARGAI